MNPLAPMLASPVDFATLRYPVYASPKLDGVRAIVREGVLLSRTLKPIPNKHLQRLFSFAEYYDGELICGDPTSPDCYRRTVSAVMTQDTIDFDVKFYVFDHLQYPLEPFSQRQALLERLELRGDASNLRGSFLTRHEHEWIYGQKSLEAYEQAIVSRGYEGLILRSPQGRYKFGRSTAKEGLMLKLKRFTDAEFEILGAVERQHNANPEFRDERGFAKHSSHQENKIGVGDLGALVLKYNKHETFNVGSGFTDQERAKLWDERTQLVGRFAKVKYFEPGMKDLPRHPVFLGLRPNIDL